jgi:cytochrome b6-f complex iron-sulfur subunit
MKRKDFLNNMARATGVGIIARALNSCAKNPSIPIPTAGFNVDLSSSANSALQTVGGFIFTQGIYVICTGSSTYTALSSICTHQGCTVAYGSTSKQFVCPCHGGTFDINGKVVSGPPPAPLTQYQVTRNGNILTIT